MSQMTAARVAPRGGTARNARGTGKRSSRLRLVHAAPVRRGNTGFALLCMAVVLGGLMALLMVNMTRIEGSFVLSDLRAESTRLHDERVTLQAELNDLRSPQALAERAEDLGMVPSPSTAVLRLSDGAVLGVASGVDGNNTFTVVTSSGTDESSSEAEPAEGSGPAAEEPGGDATEEG